MTPGTIVQKLLSAACIALILHGTVAPAVGQTMTIQSGAAAALSPEFQVDPSSLYTATGPQSAPSLTIGSQTVGPSDLYFGSGSTTATGTGVPPVIPDYNALAADRDVQITNAIGGAGNFSASGSVAAEPSAMAVLLHSTNLPSVAADPFLDPSRNLLNDPAVRASLADCAVGYHATVNSVPTTSSVTEFCETMTINPVPMTVTRTSYTPNRVWRYVVTNGVPTCVQGGYVLTINTSNPNPASVCPLLGGIQRINGSFRVDNCSSGLDGCIRMELVAATLDTAAIHPGPDDQLFTYPDLAAFCASLSSINYCGTHTASWANVGNVLPPSHQSPPVTGFYTSCVYQYATGYDPAMPQGYARIFVTSPGVTRVCTQALGEPFYVVWNGTTIRSYFQDELEAAHAFYTFGPSTPAPLTSGWIQFYRNIAITGSWAWTNTAGSDLKVNNRIFTLGTGVSDLGYYFTGNATRRYNVSLTPNGSTPRTAWLDVHFNGTTFGPFAYNSSDWSAIQYAATNYGCQIEYTILSTADGNHDGCVSEVLSPIGATTNRICGTQIPASPFDTIPDRAATSFEVKANCSSSFQTTDNCTAFKNDPQCTFLNRSCLHYGTDGSCMIWDNAYTCNQQGSYNTVTLNNTFQCTGNVSCLGGECVYDGSESGQIDLADAAAKLQATELIAGDMQCTVDPATAPNPTAAMQACEVFAGKGADCKKVVLGIANCCKGAQGVSMFDYLQLAFATARLNNVINGMGIQTPLTSAWTSLNNVARQSMSSLTQPLTQVWEGIVGNAGVTKNGASAFSMTAAKETLMRSVANWTTNTFGAQATGSIFQLQGGGAITGQVGAGQVVVFNPTMMTIMNAVSTAYAIYTITVILLSIIFACTDDEAELAMKKTLLSVHHLGNYCAQKVFGICVEKRESYCTFNSPLARILNEQLRPQLGRGWGSASNPDCRGITVGELQRVDMTRVDLSEWTGILTASGLIDSTRVLDIEKLTGTSSSLGVSLNSLYERQNAQERNVERMNGVDFDLNRNDASKEFGSGVVQP